MNQAVTQSLENLPDEILSLPRFFAVKENKEPKIKGWSKPENQKPYNEIQGLAGFDTAGHNKGDDYLFLDFDHVLNDNGEFVTVAAEQLFNRIHDQLKSYCELSASKHGIHIIAKPTAGKFKKISSGRNGRIFFNEDETAFLELFYGTGGRYCYFTGDVYQCSPKAPVTHGEAADSAFQELLDIIAARTKKTLKPVQKTTKQQDNKMTTIYQTLDERDRALNMLAVIPVADLSREDWVNVGMALKNNGNSVSDWREWSRNDDSTGKDGQPRFKDGECDDLWQGFEYGGGLTIATIHDIAKRYGYQEPKRAGTSAPMNDDQDDNFIWTQDKIKSCPVNLRLPDGYTFDQRGITKILPSKKKTDPPKYIRVCNAPIIPTKKFRDPTKNTLEYGIAIFSDDQWRNIEVSAATIGDIRELSKILNLHGGLVDEPKIVSQFINAVIALNHDIPRIKSYSKTGWTDDDCTEFIYPHADAPYILRRAGFNYDKIFKPKGNPELWKQKFVEVCEQGGAVATAYFGVALSSAIAKPIMGFNPSAHLFGKSGGGKTALQKFIASTYGTPRELVGTFAATPKNRLLTADALSGLPNFYDELETVQGKKAEEQLANDAYNFYDGKGNQANRRDGTARESFKFDSARLTSGERPYLKQHDLRGAFKRVLQLETRRIFAPYQSTADLPLELLPDDLAADLHFFAESNFGHFGKIWADFVATHKAEIETQYHHFAKFYAPLKTYEPTHLKILAGAFVSIEFFAVAIGIKSKFDEIEVQRNMRCIVDTLPTNAELDDTARALDFLRDFVAGHEKYFAREVQNKPEFNNEFTQTAFECYGKSFKNGEIAFLRNSLTQILEETGKFASAEKLINEFYDKGYLRHSDGKKTFPTFFNGKTTKMIRFAAGIISTAEQKEDTEEDVG